MRTHARAALAAVLACGGLIAAIHVGQDSGADASALPRGPYVALGDSYTAGPGIPGQNAKPAGCDRSSRNYPSLVAHRLGLTGTGFRDMSCSGATITDLTTAQSTDNGTNQAQLSALTTTTRLVTVGIGGNDIGFSSLITQCVKRGAIYYATGKDKFTGDNAPCRTQNTSDGTDQIQQRIKTAATRLATALADIKNRAPQAGVYLVGYPAILPSGAATGCDDLMLAPGDVTFLRQTEQRLNAMIQQQAKAAGVGYVDTYTPSTGHDACSSPDTRWIEPLIPLSPAAPAHPNATGEAGMADAVLTTAEAS